MGAASANAKFIVFGTQFDDASYQQNGHIQVDFGWTPLFCTKRWISPASWSSALRPMSHKLVNFTSAVENNCGISGRCCGQSQKTPGAEVD